MPPAARGGNRLRSAARRGWGSRKTDSGGEGVDARKDNLLFYLIKSGSPRADGSPLRRHHALACPFACPGGVDPTSFERGGGGKTFSKVFPPGIFLPTHSPPPRCHPVNRECWSCFALWRPCGARFWFGQEVGGRLSASARRFRFGPQPVCEAVLRMGVRTPGRKVCRTPGFGVNRQPRRRKDNVHDHYQLFCD
ncbi:hypothetical protein Daes_0652 [Pseudodesulfovibrio aespoeensis Aspo-2]|uniref:Uncharacterized protein n=1 Tax=Pseudodesulfovibrio aespoeensis (strain ATCC 700646 / DSM 10631 / Aspo-2) TaxID=643562 RepID=E6VZ07_PSEA9|nr:hypothetical protein Daes_0652 [Pseudodesulfovibrio aespoeensis Aspo-2]